MQVIIQYIRECVVEQVIDMMQALKIPLLQYFGKTGEELPIDRSFATYLIDLWKDHPVKRTLDYPKKISVPFHVAYNRPIVSRKWQNMLRGLNRDLETETFWKLDNTENRKRMRRRMKRNYSPKQYIGCAKNSTSNVEHLTEDSFFLMEESQIETNEKKEATSIYTNEFLIADGIILRNFVSQVLSFLFSQKNAEVHREGFLEKRENKSNASKTRFFILENSKLEYKRVRDVV